MCASKDEKQLATAYGLLLNELTRSPYQLLDALVKMLKLAMSLDTGSYFVSQSDIILYVIRFGECTLEHWRLHRFAGCRVENFIEYVLDYAGGRVHTTVKLRDTVIEPAVVASDH